MDKELFDDLVASCKEAIEYKKGNLKLKTTTLEIPDDEFDFYNMFEKLSKSNKHKVIQYTNELLRA